MALLSLLCINAVPQRPPVSAPGALVDVGGYRVHLYCMGTGSPVVMIAGAALSSDWALVQPEVGKFTTVCTYDPSGVAWSDAGNGASCLDRVREFHRLIVNARIALPVVMVGYSVGAIYARLYAHRYPAEIGGMVFVDHAVRLGGMAIKSRPMIRGLDSGPELLSATPIASGLEDEPSFLKLGAREQAIHRWASPGAAALLTNEIVEQCFAESDALEDNLGAMPLMVVSNRFTSADYLALQRRLLSFSSNSKQMVAGHSGHGVILDEPEVVVRAIRGVVESVRRK